MVANAVSSADTSPAFAFWICSPMNASSCPLCPRKRTCAVQLGMSAMVQKRTHAVQQEIVIRSLRQRSAGDLQHVETERALMPSRWAPMGFSSLGASRLRPWPHATRCPASTRFLIFRWPAALQVTAPASPMRIDKPASIPDGFSKGPSRLTCPSRSRSSSSWSSTSRPRKHSASQFRRRSLLAPTR
jgi:hypothetical protein